MNLGIDLELNWRVNKKHLEFCKCFFLCAYPVLCKIEHRCRTERQEPESDHDAEGAEMRQELKTLGLSTLDLSVTSLRKKKMAPGTDPP